MKGFVCPRCGSNDLALARVIHQGGTTSGRQEGYVETESWHVGEYGGQTFAQTHLAARCSPPRPPETGRPLAIILGTPFGLWCLYAMIPMRWQGDSVDLILIGLAGYVLCMNGAALWREIKESKDFQARRERYDRTCVCLRCGTDALLPEGWDREPS